MPFNYVDKALQLGYLDDSTTPNTTVLLPVWVSNSQDLARVERSIRQRAFGNVPHFMFFLRSWNSTLVAATPDNVGDAATQVDCYLYQSVNGQPITTPSYMVIRNLLLT